MASTLEELLSSARSHLYPNYRQPPLVLARGEGVLLWDSTGKRYLDLFAGIAVSTLGHAHPRLSQAIAEQAGKLLHTSNYFYTEPNIRLAEKLCQATHKDRAFFCNSGTEAIEALLKLSRRYFHARGEGERVRIIAFENSFHGRTLGALAATGQPKYRDGFGQLPNVTHVPFGDIQRVAEAMGPDVAGILVEPVQGEGGVLPAPPGFLKDLRALADEHGALLLADEIQTGVGRTGKFLGFEHDAVEADAIAMAKALGGGVPIGAMLCKQFLAEALPPGSHGTTFGGNPLASAAGLCVLEVVEEENLVNHTRDLGHYLEAELSALAKRHEAVVASTRGRGLLQALVLRDSIDARKVLSDLREAGVLLSIAGGQALRFSPPLIIKQHELDEALSLIDQTLGSAK